MFDVVQSALTIVQFGLKLFDRHFHGWEHFPQAEATVFAVKTDKVDSKANTAVVGFNLHFNTLARAEIMGLFKR